jgi:hypothetical protein
VLGSAFLLAPLSVVAGLLVMGAAVDLALPLRLALAIAAVGSGSFVGVRGWRHLGVRLTPESIRFERLFSAAEVTWADVAAVRLSWETGRIGTGYFVTVVARKGRRVSPGHVPPLEGLGSALVRRYIREHVPGVLVDPVEPWQDRFGAWHGDLLDFDPEESIRSIRRAAVGRLVIQVKVTDEGFRAVTSDASGRTVRESPLVPHLATATDAAIEHIRLARAEA